MRIFGLGTGRCGTQSLAALLNSQPNAAVSHERWAKRMAWRGSEAVLMGILSRIDESPTGLRGDVASYYLPYVEFIATRFPKTRFICLQRERTATIDSFLRVIGKRHHWLLHDGSHFELDLDWDKCFPKFDISQPALAIGEYWDRYYEDAERLDKDLGDCFRMFDISALNSAEGQQAILQHAGIDVNAQRLAVGLRTNVLGYPREEALVQHYDGNPDYFSLAGEVAVKDLMASLGITAGRLSTFLDLGCGDARVSIELAKIGVECTAIDVSAARIERARKRIEDLPIRLSHQNLHGYLRSATMDALTYDLIGLLDVLNHLEDPRRVVRDARQLGPVMAIVVVGGDCNAHLHAFRSSREMVECLAPQRTVQWDEKNWLLYWPEQPSQS